MSSSTRLTQRLQVAHKHFALSHSLSPYKSEKCLWAAGSGNNYHFAENHVHDVCRGTADAGAFYVGRTWASLGNTIERNVFNRTANVEEMAQHTQTVGVPSLSNIYGIFMCRICM